MNVARLIRDARRRAGLTQAEVARRAGTSQPTVAAYEAGSRSPSVDTLERLLAATGHRLEARAAPRDSTSDLSGPVGSRLREHRKQVREILKRRGAERPRVFGSVARGEDREDSDLDLLIRVPSGFTLLDQAAVIRELRELLGVHVDVVTDGALDEEDLRRLEREAVPL